MKFHSFSLLPLFSIATFFLTGSEALLQHEKYKVHNNNDIVPGRYIIEYEQVDKDHSLVQSLKSVFKLDIANLHPITHNLFNGFIFDLNDPKPSTTSDQPSDYEKKLQSFLDNKNIKAVYPVETFELADTAPVDNDFKTKALASNDDQSVAGLILPHRLTQVDRVHKELNNTGKGIIVGVIDTGIDYLHPALGGGFGPGFKVAYGGDLVGNKIDKSKPTPPPSAELPPPLDNCSPDSHATGHGTHVAGIIAGKSDNFTGVAPDATLAVWRIYDCEKKSGTDTILSALMRAYDTKCDVVSLSLGSSNKAAIQPIAGILTKLVNEGIHVVGSGGNSGTDGAFTIEYPGSFPGIGSIGSFDNEYQYIYDFQTSGSLDANIYYATENQIPQDLPKGELIIGDSNVVGCAVDGIPDDIKGKYGLLKRGNCTIIKKIENLASKGAIGVVIYDSVSNDPEGARNGTIPSMGIGLNDGLKLTEAIKKGPLSISFTGKHVAAPGSSGNLVSAFSSIGSNIDLELRPNLAGIGGNVYSTMPSYRGNWAVMSGTSMSTPYIAGSIALYLKSLESDKRTGPKFTLEHLQHYAYKAPSKKGGKDIDHPLRQGAGLVQLYDAITQKVHITPGQLEFNDTSIASSVYKTQTLTITNNGKQAVTYQVSNNVSLSIQPYDLEKSGYAFTQPVQYSKTPDSAELTFSQTTIELAPGKSANITVTVVPPTTDPKEHIMYGGYVQFKSSNTDTALDLTVPYFGVVGNQRDIPIFDKDYPYISDKDDGMTRYNESQTYQLGNGFGKKDVYFISRAIYPSGYLKYELLDATTEEVIGIPLKPKKFVPRNSLNKGDIFSPYQWVGTYQPNDGSGFIPTPDGIYKVRISALKVFGNPELATDYVTWTSNNIEIKN